MSGKSEIEAVQAPWENPVRATLRSGHAAFALGVATSDLRLVFQIANLGFDFLWLEMEHSALSLEGVANIVLTTRGCRSIPFARVPAPIDWVAKGVLDAGVLGVVFPHVNTSEQTRQVVAACKFAPEGSRSAAGSVAALRWQPPGDFYEFSNRNVMPVAIVEESAAVENVEAIAATPGLEMIFIGANDLQHSLGVDGVDHPRMRQAIARIVEAGRKHGIYVGISETDPARIERRLAEGFSWFYCGGPETLLADAASRFLNACGKKVNRVDWTNIPPTF